MPPDAPPDLPPDGVRITPDAANPVVVEVLRGGHVESRHRGAAIAVRADGHVALSWGDVDRPVFPRSAIKPLQALPLIETGAADAFGLDEAEIALACASHNGEPLHTDRVAAWLARLGLSEADLECGAHWPKHEPAAHDLARAGAAPSALHNNCSGKHAGFLTTAVHRGEPTAGYVHRHHPVQQRVMGVMEQMCGLDLSAAPCGIDGCSIPTFALPLGNLALGMARFGAADDLPPDRAAAAARIRAAVAARPEMIAGTDRYCTELNRVGAGRLLVKTGAEGVFCGLAPAFGVGLAVKCDDGATRAAEVMMSALLATLGLLDEAELDGLGHRLRPQLHNWRGTLVGEIRPTGPLAGSLAGAGPEG